MPHFYEAELEHVGHLSDEDIELLLAENTEGQNDED